LSGTLFTFPSAMKLRRGNLPWQDVQFFAGNLARLGSRDGRRNALALLRHGYENRSARTGLTTAVASP